jgi:chlorobactene glucosyltransferase
MSDMWPLLAWSGLTCAALPLWMTLLNLRRYRVPADSKPIDERVDVCIPARNEASNIEACVEGALSSAGVSVRALVYDDQSTDDTPGILERLALKHGGLVRVPTQALPDGWNGKQWGCERMGQIGRASCRERVYASV